jgi:hypothetical protein
MMAEALAETTSDGEETNADVAEENPGPCAATGRGLFANSTELSLRRIFIK